MTKPRDEVEDNVSRALGVALLQVELAMYEATTGEAYDLLGDLVDARHAVMRAKPPEPTPIPVYENSEIGD